MTKPIPDQAERELALNPAHSFIVQAPAGSGKTELLTQRFLRLLACVNEPEEILAITFTKKAASEMRSRIRDALSKAQQETRPETSHEQRTWLLAQNALKQDQERGWNLLANPNRLRVKTIDAFNTLLTRQLPLLSQFGAAPEIMDYPRSLYREAVQTFLTHLEENLAWSNAIAQLLLHLDNNLETTEKLLIDMLSKRDQWLPHILAPNALRQVLENNLKTVIEESLSRLKELFPKKHIPELLSLLHFACENLRNSNPNSPYLCCSHLKALPGAETKDLALWLSLAEFLLTKSDKTWRKNLDKRLGFPPAGKSKSQGPDLNALQKERMQALLEEFSQNELLYRALVDLFYLPEPAYSESQWLMLQALQDVLKIVAAQLHVIFKLTGKIDYTENALAALLALGQEDSPTDLALVLDYQLKHILVDEFQDTSSGQYELLSKLVRDWQPGDGRSLFLVGDPMQSIYRFREAEVGLFLRARQQGIGAIKLKPLTLSVNFRSTPAIVDWINHHFRSVLPAYDEIASGAVSYTPSISNGKTELGQDQAVSLHAFLNTDSQAQTQGLVQLIQQELNEKPQDLIAILVRSRSHLKALIPALKQAQLAYQAVEIDPLESRPLIQDLLALTRALLYPGDSLAWLAILRAPWCGLNLQDLFILSGSREQELIWPRLSRGELQTQLSASGLKRLQRILPALNAALAERHREDLPLWIEKTWLALGGPACVENEAELQDARLFFNLLKKLTLNQTGLSLKWSALEEALKQLYAKPSTATECRVHIMTMHTAKGLEFDTVILPHLEKGTHPSDKPLLTWLERPLSSNNRALLLAPIQAVGENEDKTYEHIRQQDKNKTQHEQGRLLYVAATRAKKSLHLCLSVNVDDKGNYQLPLEGSLLKKLWPSIEGELTPCAANNPSKIEHKTNTRHLKRLSEEWAHPLPLKTAAERPAHNKIQGFHLAQNTAPAVGTVVHFVLQQITRLGLSWWQTKSSREHRAYLKGLLLTKGILASQVQAPVEKAEKAIDNALSDARGQWLFQDWRETQAEYALVTLIENKPQKLIIDKTFIDEQGQRWIIDYKITAPENQEISVFLDQEKKKYAKKMHHYQLALSRLGQHPIRLGLYFPLVPAWCEWENRVERI